MSYLELALKAKRIIESEATESQNAYSTRCEISEKREVSNSRFAPCGSPDCAGCYEIEPGVRIHPPKQGAEWLAWLAKWEPKSSKIQ